MKSKSLVLFCFIILLSVTNLVTGQDAVIKEEKQIFKTYPFSNPDPIPNIGRIYPYFKYSDYSYKGQEHEWNVVRMENPFIKVLVTPEIGGKIWGATEKSTGRPFIYLNKVVKFRNIAMRGPWTSGGIEFNFGSIGHTPTTATPVDYVMQKNDDGSVSCIVGALDLSSRTEWRVKINLPKDKAWFETECFWFNPTPLNTSCYHWMNAAANAEKDLHIIAPGNTHIGHSGDAHSWPVDDKKRDISLYANNNFGPAKSYHVIGEYTEHFGGYYNNADFGYVNWSLYDDKPGKKVWLWAQSREGEIWRDLLTDEGNSQYIEFQTGLLLNQAGAASSKTPFKHANLAPYSLNDWNELWFPVKGTGGITNASPYGSLNVTQEKNVLKIALCPIQKLDDDLVVTSAGKPIYTKHIRLDPMDVFLDSLDLTQANANMRVTVGGNKLTFSSADKKNKTLNRPILMNKDFNWNSAEGLCLTGEELERQRDYAGALNKFQACVQKEPAHCRALSRIAELYYRRAEYDTALDYAKKVLAVNAYDAGANFIYGLINTEFGQFADAKDGFGWAARSMEYRSAAYTQMARVYNIESDFTQALHYAQRALEYNVHNLEAYKSVAIIHRINNDREKAEKVISKILDLDPLNHFARFEHYLLDPDDKNLATFKAHIRNELPYETFLELAMTYVNLGQYHDAITVLQNAPDYSSIYYWLAYLYSKIENPEQSQLLLVKAEKSSPKLVFPFRQEMIPVMKWAKTENDTDWKAAYYLGLIYWNLGRINEAKELFQQCGEEPDYAPFYTARSQLFRGESTEQTRKDLIHATRIDIKEWRTWHLLTNHYTSQNSYKEALKSSRYIYKKQSDNSLLALDYAKVLLYNNKFKECMDVLKKTTVLPNEGAWQGHALYRQAHLLYAVENMKKGNVKKSCATC